MLTKQVAWRVEEWRRAVPMSRSQIQEFIKDGYVSSIRIAGARYITESPEAFVERHRTPAKE
jgi:hypothetical protein